MKDYNIGEFEYYNNENYARRKELRETSEVMEVPEGESLTVPGEAMTIKEIMERALRGMPPVASNAEFFDQEDLEKIDEFYGAPGS